MPADGLRAKHDGGSLVAAHHWKPGDLCRLVNLREGKVYDDGVIDTVKGRKVTVVAGGQRWFVELPSSFLQERPKA